MMVGNMAEIAPCQALRLAGAGRASLSRDRQGADRKELSPLLADVHNDHPHRLHNSLSLG